MTALRKGVSLGLSAAAAGLLLWGATKPYLPTPGLELVSSLSIGSLGALLLWAAFEAWPR